MVFEEIFLIPLILKIRKKAAGLLELQSYQIVSILIFSLARELCFTGRRFTAEEALQFGFVRFVLWCCDTSYKLSSKSNASVSLKLQLHPWQSLGIWTFEDGLFKFALLWAKTVFKCLNKCQIWSSIFLKKTTLASMKLCCGAFLLGHLCVKVNCWPWNISIKRQNMFIQMERPDSFCSNACGLPVGFQGGRGKERFWSFEMTYALSIESIVLQSFTIWSNPLLSWLFLFILGLSFSLLCVLSYGTNIFDNVVIYHL